MTERYKEYLTETSLSRVFKHMKGHDTGTITAFRDKKECGGSEIYTKKEKLQRNKSLLAKLQSKGYGVTSIKGTYIENFNSKDPKKPPKEVSENVFFVVDLKDSGNLLRDMKKLGELFDQDSILFIPKGGSNSTLHGTNHCSDFPGYGKKVSFSKRSLGDKGEFFSKVGGRPFVFKEDVSQIKEHVVPSGYFGLWGLKAVANQPWCEIEVDE